METHTDYRHRQEKQSPLHNRRGRLLLRRSCLEDAETSFLDFPIILDSRFESHESNEPYQGIQGYFTKLTAYEILDYECLQRRPIHLSSFNMEFNALVENSPGVFILGAIRFLATRSPEIVFLAFTGFPIPILLTASAEALEQGVTADVALLSSRRIHECDFYQALAKALDAPFIFNDPLLPQPTDYQQAIQSGAALLKSGGSGRRWLMAPRGKAIAALLAEGERAALAVTTPRLFSSFIRSAASEQLAQDATYSVAALEPRLSAMRCSQDIFVRRLIFTALLVLFLVDLAPTQWAYIPELVFAACFGLSAYVRLLISLRQNRKKTSPSETVPLQDKDLPIYTIISPLYHEAEVVDSLIQALENLNYPRSKLDIKFVIEEGDEETYAALASKLPGFEYELIVAPPGGPRTKPRALNIALACARGELVTVFDAEDKPHPNQLRRAAERFAAASPDLACLQARLIVDNYDDNWFAAFYAMEYAALFEVINPGFTRFRLPVPLGGTSNHFRTVVLLRLAAWDAWNVTEDADLGIRLARCGYDVEMLSSYTSEEAPNRLLPLLRQRSRWIKGWMQTGIVHMRDPVALWRNLRAKSFAVLIATFFINVVGPIFWPFFTFFLVYNLWMNRMFANVWAIGLILSVIALLLAFFGFLAMCIPMIIGVRRQKRSRLWPYLLLFPVWQFFLTIAAWLALVELWRDPHGWMKTPHGLAKSHDLQSKFYLQD